MHQYKAYYSVAIVTYKRKFVHSVLRVFVIS